MSLYIFSSFFRDKKKHSNLSLFGLANNNIKLSVIIALAQSHNIYLDNSVDDEILEKLTTLEVTVTNFSADCLKREGLAPTDLAFHSWDDLLDLLQEHPTSPLFAITNLPDCISSLVENKLLYRTLSKLNPEEMICLTAQYNLDLAKQLTYTNSTVLNLKKTAHMIRQSIHDGGRLFLFGNGGSAADSQHIAAEFVSRLKTDRKPLPAIALTTDTSALTAIGNDYGFEYVFERQVQALVNAKDVVIGITTSGTSRNVIRGLDTANDLGAKTVLMTGNKTFTTAKYDCILNVHSDVVATIQEIHIQFGHVICGMAEIEYV